MKSRVSAVSLRTEIGKRYLVPCVQANESAFNYKPWFAHYGEWVPILLPAHDDPEISKGGYHFHLDHRFISKSLWNRLRYHRFAGAGSVIWFQDGGADSLLVSTTPVLKIRLCKRRPLSSFPTDKHVHGTLEKLYEGKCVVGGKCPHRGVDLTDCSDASGFIVCPGHGLVINAATRQVIAGAPAAAHRF